MSRDTNDHSDNPYRPRARTVRDPHHDAQLLRDVAIINAQVRDRLGPLPAGGLPVHPKRKPNLPPPPSVTAASAIYPPEDDPMKLHHLAAAAILPMAVAAAGCSKGIDAGGVKAQLNPHPQKRYEVIATSHAPGPWDSFEGGYIGYDVINTKCVPMIAFIGEQHRPNTGLDVPMTRVDDHSWKGYFYRDALQDEDYFKLGVCHWDVTSVSVSAIAQGVRFAWSGSPEELLRNGPETRYFKKSVYGDRSFVLDGAPDLDPADPEVLQNPDAYFPVTIAVKEVTP
ncbi:hypothetical protein KCU57_05290 [Xanthomonas translucens]|uniref:hypothetical protein n=1 Tax=Xanthomonas campestris pv. translucens TaxID=343 RepID=UPI001F451C18|nr:hypothetical protein [Xanthomonas translucens]UKE51730.1 hypothetical protein KCU57_05290 [Xanthomonas translucens]